MRNPPERRRPAEHSVTPRRTLRARQPGLYSDQVTARERTGRERSADDHSPDVRRLWRHAAYAALLRIARIAVPRAARPAAALQPRRSCPADPDPARPPLWLFARTDPAVAGTVRPGRAQHHPDRGRAWRSARAAG